MIIGFDAKRAVSNFTGLGNYSRLVVDSIAKRFPHCDLRLFAPAMTDNPRLNPILALPNVSTILPSGNGLMQRGALWRTWGISKQLKESGIDIFHGLSNELPLSIRKSGIPSIVTIHDLIFRRHPEFYSPFDAAIYDFKYGLSCRIADRIIAISKRTADDISELYGIDPEKIDIIYQGCAESFKHPATRNTLEKIKEKYSLPERFIIQVGTIERRKNLELTVKALSALPADVNLIAVGRDRKYLKRIKSIASELGVRNRIKVLQSVPFAELPALYQLASAAAYPSLYEGFGIPILESLESGCPTVAATGSCLEEAGGESAFYVNPHSPREMAQALKAALTKTPEIVSRIAMGKRHASRFNNAEIPSKIIDAYRRTIDLYKSKSKH